MKVRVTREWEGDELVHVYPLRARERSEYVYVCDKWWRKMGGPVPKEGEVWECEIQATNGKRVKA